MKPLVLPLCKVVDSTLRIPDSRNCNPDLYLGFRIPRFGFQIPGTAFQIYILDPGFLVSGFQSLAPFQNPRAEFKIPKARISDSTSLNFSDSGTQITYMRQFSIGIRENFACGMWNTARGIQNPRSTDKES